MRRVSLILAALLPCLLLVGPGIATAEDLKQIHPTGYVTDLAGVIHADSRMRMEALCGEVEQKTGAQMAVVTVHSLEGESVEDYAVDLFKQLGVGSKKDNRGVMLLIAPSERKYRIEVGYGLEPVINDARAGDAGRSMVPYLRQNDYGRAAEVGAWQLAKYIADDAHVTLSGQPPMRTYGPRRGNDANPFFWIFSGAGILFTVLPFLLVLSLIGRLFGGRRGGSGGGLLWFLLGMLLSESGRGSRGGWGGGGFGGGGGGGWGGGDSGGGGFGGFGGGSSGGGGASGSW